MIKLNYMIVPNELERVAYVENPVIITITDVDSELFYGVLGESGRELARSGALFYFEKDLANKLIKQGVAKMTKTIKERNLELIDEMRQMRYLPKEERPAAGMKLNEKVAKLKEDIRNEEVDKQTKDDLGRTI
jgi:hypothetical protein